MYWIIYLRYFQTFRVRTSSRLAAMRKMPPPKYPNVQAEKTKIAGVARRVKQLAVVPNVISSPKRKITSNIGRKTKAAMHKTEKR